MWNERKGAGFTSPRVRRRSVGASYPKTYNSYELGKLGEGREMAKKAMEDVDKEGVEGRRSEQGDKRGKRVGNKAVYLAKNLLLKQSRWLGPFALAYAMLDNSPDSWPSMWGWTNAHVTVTSFWVQVYWFNAFASAFVSGRKEKRNSRFGHKGTLAGCFCVQMKREKFKKISLRLIIGVLWGCLYVDRGLRAPRIFTLGRLGMTSEIAPRVL